MQLLIAKMKPTIEVLLSASYGLLSSGLTLWGISIDSMNSHVIPNYLSNSVTSNNNFWHKLLQYTAEKVCTEYHIHNSIYKLV